MHVVLPDPLKQLPPLVALAPVGAATPPDGLPTTRGDPVGDWLVVPAGVTPVTPYDDKAEVREVVVDPLVRADAKAVAEVVVLVVVTVYLTDVSNNDRRRRLVAPLIVTAEAGTLAAVAMLAMKAFCMADEAINVDAETPANNTVACTCMVGVFVGAAVGVGALTGDEVGPVASVPTPLIDMPGSV